MSRMATLLIFTTFIFIVMEFNNADRFNNTSLINSTTFSLFRAAHDASLQVDPLMYADGYIVFMQEKAREVFIYTMSRNMGLKSDLTPRPGSNLTNAMEILFEDYVDDLSGVSFPYNYRNDQYQIFKTLEGPAVIYMVRIKAPRTYEYSFDGYIYKNIIQQYPLPR